MIGQKNVSSLGILNTVAGAFVTSGTIKDINTNGDIGLLDASGKLKAVADITGTNAEYRIAIYEGGYLWVSDYFNPQNISFATPTGSEVYVAPTLQVTYLGYDAVNDAGAIDVLTNNKYVLDAKVVSGAAVFGNHSRFVGGYHVTGAAATQIEIAEGVVKNAILNNGSAVEDIISYGVVSSEAGDANTGAGTVTTQKGSKVVAFGTDVDAVATVGDYLRFDVSAGAAPDETDPIYRIVSIDATANTATLNYPYAGESLSAVAEGNVLVVTAADALAADSGIKIEAKKRTNFAAGYTKYIVPSYDINFWESGTTPKSEVSYSSKGYGAYEQIAETEFNFQGSDGGALYKNKFPVRPGRTIADSLVNYDVINIVYTKPTETNFAQKASNPAEMIIAVNEANTGSVVANLQTILNL